MSALEALRSAIVADFEAAIPDADEVRSYGGRLNLGEVKRLASRKRAIMVAMVNGGGSLPMPNNQLRVEILLSAFIIAEDERGKDRDVVALSLAEQVIGRVAAWPWRGVATSSEPQEVKFESLYSGDIDRRGLALLAVTWKQSLPLGIDRFEAERVAAELPDHADPEGLTVSGAVFGVDDAGGGP